MYSEEARQKARETYYKYGKNMDSFTVVSPWGATFSEKGIKPFCRRMGISHTSLSSVIHGKSYIVNGWHLPKNDPLLPLKLFRKGKTREEVGEIIGIEITYQITNLFPPPKEGHKWCSRCFQELPLDKFDFNWNMHGKSKTNRRSACKCCKLEQDRKRRKSRLDRG